jgi:hypothetical protein
VPIGIGIAPTLILLFFFIIFFIIFNDLQSWLFLIILACVFIIPTIPLAILALRDYRYERKLFDLDPILQKRDLEGMLKNENIKFVKKETTTRFLIPFGKIKETIFYIGEYEINIKINDITRYIYIGPISSTNHNEVIKLKNKIDKKFNQYEITPIISEYN